MTLNDTRNPSTPMAVYRDNVQKAFAHFGFVSDPMCSDSIDLCHAQGFSENDAYQLGCDLAAENYTSVLSGVEDYAERIAADEY